MKNSNGTWKWRCYQLYLALWYNHQKVSTNTGGLGNNGMSGDHPNYSIIEIGLNTKKSPGDLRTCCYSNSSERSSRSNIIIIIIIINRLYVPRKEGGRGLASIEDSVDTSIQRLDDYIKKPERELIRAIRNNTDNTNDKN